jgi:sugar (pentulose or hexulose) kinase
MKVRNVAVIDIGKTNAKLALVDAVDLSEISVVTRPNRVQPGPPYRHFDVEGHWAFLLHHLGDLHARFGIDAITVTTHGASGVLLTAEGDLAAPVLDYEEQQIEEASADYDLLRPDFTETGSPRLAGGLNFGAQVHWQFSRDPALYERTATIMTYPQYWGFRLTGVRASDLSSLGCHTDFWSPSQGCFSSLVERLNIANKLAPPLPANAVLGPVLPAIAEQTGLNTVTPVYCGIHDSNASLLPHVLTRQEPYSVVSTGTWIIVMTVQGKEVVLDAARDTLINVNAFGDPVPSARFMGGREFEQLSQGQNPEITDADLAEVAATGPLFLPAVIQDSGPFPGWKGRWLQPEPAVGSVSRAVAIGFYLALVSAQCLRLTGHQGDIVVEGPFSRNNPFCRMLSAATGCGIVRAQGVTGTSQGAALLALDGTLPARLQSREPAQVETDPAIMAYAARWLSAVEG